MSIFVQDTFSNGTDLVAAHTAEVGGPWIRHPGSSTGSISLTAGYVTANTTNTSEYYASGAPASADYDVEATFQCISASTKGYRVGIHGRMDANLRTHYHARYIANTSLWTLYSFVDGAATVLGTYSDALTANAQRLVKLQMRGSAIKVFIDGVERISTTNTAITAAGRAGLSAMNDGGGQYALLDFTATDATTIDSIANLNITLDDASFNGDVLSGCIASLNLQTDDSVFSGSGSSSGSATFTSYPLYALSGALEASVDLNFVRLYNESTGALVLNKTGLSTNAAGIFSFSDPALTAINYRVDWETSTGHRRMPIKAAS